jgi:hypothetical protein
VAGPSRRPSRKTSSVKLAVERFNTGEGDADPSILLPSPHASPARKGNPKQNKGKARAMEGWDKCDDGHIFGEVRVRGKERELVAAREELRRREDGEPKDAEEAEREKARDKDRIRALEEEIERLKQEVGCPFSLFLSLNKLCSYHGDLHLHRSHSRLRLRLLRLLHLPFVLGPQIAQE